MYALARRVEGLRQVVDDSCERRLAGAALEDLDRDRVGLEHALRRQQHPAALRLVVREPDAARQARLCVRAIMPSSATDQSPGFAHCRIPGTGRCVIRQLQHQKPTDSGESNAQGWAEFEIVIGCMSAIAVARKLCRLQAQDYPSKPGHIITPAAAGNSPDVMTRIVADKLSQMWKQQIVVLNRPGAGGLIAAQAAAASSIEKDGYTLYMTQAST